MGRREEERRWRVGRRVGGNDGEKNAGEGGEGEPKGLKKK